MPTFPRRQPTRGEERDLAHCPSDFSMEDGNGGGPSNLSPSAQLDAGSKSDKDFPAKLEEVLQKLPQYIEQLDDDTLLIRDVTNFFAHALRQYFGGIRGVNWSLWVRNRKAARSNDPAPQNTVQEQPPTASVPVAAIMAYLPSAQPDLEARVDELQNELNTTNSELSATKSKLKETQQFACNTQIEVNELRGFVLQWIAMQTQAVASAGSGPSQSVPDSEPGLLAHSPSQMHQAGGHGGTHDGSPLKPKTGANEALQGVLETAAPPYIPNDHTFAAGQPDHSRSYGGGFDANPSIAQPYVGGHTTAGETVSHVFLMHDGPSTMPQGASTSSAHQQSSAFAADAPDSSQYNFSSSSHPPPTRTPPGNFSGAFGGARPPTGFSVVPPMTNRNTSNQGPQAYHPRYR
ncbi:hypothetical protein FS837_011273 [Tulasnella sp. UAMH 9824]|nr:hypothetical protein FS837_011273 [Tulasnella sp. UAMH 9824]